MFTKFVWLSPKGYKFIWLNNEKLKNDPIIQLNCKIYCLLGNRQPPG